MSISDLIDRGLFAEEPKQKKIKKVDDIPEEIRYKLKQYDTYKDLGHNKVAYLQQMLIRIAFIREWHKFKYNEIQLTFLHLLINNNLITAFKAIVILLWVDISFAENNLSLIFDKFHIFDIKEDKKYYRDYIKHLSRSLISSTILQPYEKNTEYIKKKFFQPAMKVKTIDAAKQLPVSNILISIDPFSDSRTLTTSIKRIIHHEKQRLKKNAVNRNKDILFDKEYDTFQEYNILLYMDIYLFLEVFNLTPSDEFWAQVLLNREEPGSKEERKKLINKCRKQLDKIQENMYDIEYISKLQQKLKTEILLKFVTVSD
ncbi:MAG: hypothetical protein MR350_05750 [Alphaproteobacteria bacterium]|nr:hypothetical protein [Alphaproteobacteria bacterium]